MKKRNYIGAAECRIWMRETYVGKDASNLSREDLEASDVDIAKRFNITHVTVSNIRRELGVYKACDRMYIASNLRPKGVEIAPEQEPEKYARPTFPEWVKEGAWVVSSSDITGESFLGEIVEVCKEAFHVRICEKDLVFSYSPEESTCDVFPVRFEPYNYKQAKQLLGKVVEYKNGPRSKIQIITNVSKSECFEEVYINDLRFATLKEMGATIDGVPFGVPEIDFEACRAKTPES